MSDEPRRHHYVAKMYLAGFTNTGTKSGKLWVADSNRGYHKKSLPDGIAHSRDFYRVDIPDVDPFIIERELGNIEGDVAAVLKNVIANKCLPENKDLSLLLNFVALQMTKTPAMRETLAKPMIAVLERVMDLMLQSPDRFYSSVEGAKKAGRDIDDTVSYEEMKRTFDQDGFIVSNSSYNFS